MAFEDYRLIGSVHCHGDCPRMVAFSAPMNATVLRYLRELGWTRQEQGQVFRGAGLDLSGWSCRDHGHGATGEQPRVRRVTGHKKTDGHPHE